MPRIENMVFKQVGQRIHIRDVKKRNGEIVSFTIDVADKFRLPDGRIAESNWSMKLKKSDIVGRKK